MQYYLIGVIIIQKQKEKDQYAIKMSQNYDKDPRVLYDKDAIYYEINGIKSL